MAISNSSERIAATSTPLARISQKPVLLNTWRIFIALWYLGGCAIHVQCALFRADIYARFGRAPLYGFVGRVWVTLVMPHITAFALLLAAFELTIVILLLSSGRAVKIALAASLLFNLFLVQLGLGYPAVPGSLQDFVRNRLSNVLFILIQMPLFWMPFDKSLPALIRARLR